MRPPAERLSRAFTTLLLPALFGLALAACRTTPPPVVDFTEPGWSQRTGQAVWRPRAGQPDVAGELTVATHADGRWWVEFSKPPLPLVVALRDDAGWRLKSTLHGEFKGRGTPPAETAWLVLAGCLAGDAPPSRWAFTPRAGDPGAWELSNAATGESLRGFLAP
jgi:hypothetical protein